MIKLPFSAEPASPFNLLILDCMIVNWNGLSGAGEQNKFTKYYPPKKQIHRTKQLTPKQIHCPKHCMRSNSWWSGVKDDQRFICHVNCNVNNCMLIHQSKIQIWEDWKCYRTHTCKVYCTFLSSSDQVAKGFFYTRVSHKFCCFSWIYLLLSREKRQNEI